MVKTPTTVHVSLVLDLSEHDITKLASVTGVDLRSVRAVVTALIRRHQYQTDQLRGEVARLRTQLGQCGNQATGLFDTLLTCTEPAGHEPPHGDDNGTTWEELNA